MNFAPRFFFHPAFCFYNCHSSRVSGILIQCPGTQDPLLTGQASLPTGIIPCATSFLANVIDIAFAMSRCTSYDRGPCAAYWIFFLNFYDVMLSASNRLCAKICMSLWLLMCIYCTSRSLLVLHHVWLLILANAMSELTPAVQAGWLAIPHLHLIWPQWCSSLNWTVSSLI